MTEIAPKWPEGYVNIGRTRMQEGSLEDARAAFEKALALYDQPNVPLPKPMVPYLRARTQNFYGQFKERDTGRGAIQLVVDRYTGRAMPEMGPNMMWNTKYGQAMMQVVMTATGSAP